MYQSTTKLHIIVSKNIGNFCNIDEMTFYLGFDSIFNFFDSFIPSLNPFKYFMKSVQTILSLPSLYSLTTEKLRELQDNRETFSFYDPSQQLKTEILYLFPKQLQENVPLFLIFRDFCFNPSSF